MHSIKCFGIMPKNRVRIWYHIEFNNSEPFTKVTCMFELSVGLSKLRRAFFKFIMNIHFKI